jgi:dihydrolipoamide dehydrogenase
MHMDEFPKSLVILGAGVIGCEFATMLSNFGKTKVYLIDKADRILPFEDEDISRVVSDQLKEMGAVVHGSSNLKRMEVVDGEVEYELVHQDGSTEVIRVEKALLSVGRVPNVESLNLENAGVQMSRRGLHIEDIDTQTNISGHLALVNVGEREARHAVVKMFADFPIEPIHYNNISTIMFLSPEVAAVGINEQDAIEKNIAVRVAKIDYTMIARAIAMRLTNGFFKIIVTDDDEMKILGMRAVGEHASSAIQGVALLMYMNRGIDELANVILPHPSIGEGIQECVRMLLGNSIYKSSVFADKLQCYSLKNGEKIDLNHIKEKVS